MTKWILFIDGITEGIYNKKNKEKGYIFYLQCRMAKIPAQWIKI